MSMKQTRPLHEYMYPDECICVRMCVGTYTPELVLLSFLHLFSRSPYSFSANSSCKRSVGFLGFYECPYLICMSAYAYVCVCMATRDESVSLVSESCMYTCRGRCVCKVLRIFGERRAFYQPTRKRQNSRGSNFKKRAFSVLKELCSNT